MHGIAVGECRAALVGKIADGVINVRAILLSLVRAKRATGGDQPVR
jgi:hypothetical protein